MLVLRTTCEVTADKKEILRTEVKKHTGEDCIIVDNGIDISEITLKKEQPLWRRLFRRA